MGKVVMAQARVPYLVGHTEIAALFHVARQTSQKWRTEGTFPEPDLVVSGNPYWLLATALRISDVGDRQVDPGRLAAYKTSLPRGYDVGLVDHLPVIVGVQEVARLLGTTPQTIARWRNRGTLPEADLTLSRSPLWVLKTIESDAHNQGRSIDRGEVQRLQRGQRPPQKPRGRPTRASSSRPSRMPLPQGRTFKPEQRGEAVRFLEELLDGEHTVFIHPG